VSRVPRERVERYARLIHRLGERGLAELLAELLDGKPPLERIERYARLEVELGDFVRALDGHTLRPPIVVADNEDCGDAA
jgi:hypothetical protein